MTCQPSSTFTALPPARSPKRAAICIAGFSAVGARVIQPDLVDGEFRDTTISAQLEVVNRAVRDDEPDLLVGSSLGGYLAALYASREPSRLPALVLLAPAFNFVRRWAGQLGCEQMDAWKQSGEMPVYHYGLGAMSSIGYGFFEDALRHEPFPAAPQPTVIFHGRNDELVDPQVSVQYARGKPQVRLELVDSDHQLLDVLEPIGERMLRFYRELEPFRGAWAYSDT